MKLRSKLLLAYLAVTALVLAVLYVGFSANKMADKTFEQAAVHALPIERALQHLRGAAMRIVSSTSESLFLTAGQQASAVDAAGARVAARELSKEGRLIEDAERDFERALRRYQVLSDQGGGKDVLTIRDIGLTSASLLSESRALLATANARSGLSELLEGKERFEAAETRLIRLIDSAIAREELRISGVIETSAIQLANARSHFASLAVFLCITAIAMGMTLTYFISRPIQNLITRAARIEQQHEAAHEDQDQKLHREISSAQVRSRSRDEVQELNLAFDAMEKRLAESRERLRQHRDNLTSQVALRTRDLEEALQRAETLTREARAASDAKAAFLATMSHEIRTPLNGVIGTAELLGHTELKAHQHELVQTITRSGDSLLRIINDILDFSKIDAGRLDLDHAPFSPGTVMEEVVTLLAPGALGKSLDFVADIGPATYVSVLGDAGRLRQIALNLLSNAIKFTERGEICVRANAQMAQGHNILLSVDITDTGIGMSDEVQKRLFQPFSQADASTTRRYGGTGLGLAISRQLAELMQGTLQVHSAEGQGTSFRIEIALPLDTAADATARTPAQGLDALLYIAHVSARRAAVQQLHAIGFQVEAASSLQEATEMAHRKTFSAIMAEGLDSEAGAPLAALATSAGTELIPIGPFAAQPASRLAARVRFQFTKPLLRGQLLSFLRHRNTPAGPTPRALQATASQPRLSGKAGLRVMVVEDNAVNRMVALQMLRRLGIDARAVNHGADAVRTQFDDPHDLILMDCHMPEMDGYEATRLIREREAEQGLRHTPIIALTANALKGDRELTLEAGMDDYLSKPVSMDSLARALEKWMAARADAVAEESLSST